MLIVLDSLDDRHFYRNFNLATRTPRRGLAELIVGPVTGWAPEAQILDFL